MYWNFASASDFWECFKAGCYPELAFNLSCVLFQVFSSAPVTPLCHWYLHGLSPPPRISKETSETCFEGGCFCSCHLSCHEVLFNCNLLSDSPIIPALWFSFELGYCFRKDRYPCWRRVVHCSIYSFIKLLFYWLYTWLSLRFVCDLHVLSFSWALEGIAGLAC